MTPASTHPGLQAGILSFFSQDHRDCDAAWAQVEGSAANPGGAAAALSHFDAVLRRHLAMEEDVLVPAFEAATGMTRGPTTVMRMEHQQMRGVLDAMAAAAREGDWDGVLDQGDTLLMLIGQHNAKEEGMLYPMCEAHLGSQWPGLSQQLGTYIS